MSSLRDALGEASTRNEPPLGFDPVVALNRGRARRRARYAIAATGTLVLTVAATAGVVAATAGSSSGRSTVLLTKPDPTGHSQPEPSPTFAPSPLGSDGPACGQFDPNIAQVAQNTLPHVGTWGPVTAAPGLCDAGYRSFAVTIHIGAKVGYLSVVISPAEYRQCPDKGQPLTSGPTQMLPGTLTCRVLPEGDLIVIDKQTTTRAGSPPIEMASAWLVMKNGFMINAQTTGGPDHSPSEFPPVGPEPYSGADLTTLVTALADTPEIASMAPAAFHTTS